MKNKNMDGTLHQNKRFLKKIAQFLLSFSFFSFIFSNSKWYPVLLHSFKHCFSPFPIFQLLTHGFDKNSIFLLSSGIVVLIAKTSGSISVSSPFDLNEQFMDKIGDGLETSPEILTTIPMLKNDEEEEEKPDEEEEEKHDDEKPEEKPEEEEPKENSIEEQRENSNFSVEMHEEEEEEEDGDNVVEEEEENDEMLSTEELNKKFDEFIRKMKEELRVEAQQQQLVLVN